MSIKHHESQREPRKVGRPRGGVPTDRRRVERALERACRAAGGPVRTTDVVREITGAGDIALLGERFATNPSQYVSKHLTHSLAAGSVFVASKVAGRNAWGHPAVLPTPAEKVIEPSVRQRVLSLVQNAVRRLKGAVRLADVVAEAERTGSAVTRLQIASNLTSLAHGFGKQLRIVDNAHGKGAGGWVLYVPKERERDTAERNQLPDEEHAAVVRSPTGIWTRQVLMAFDKVWVQRVAGAETIGVLPVPVQSHNVVPELEGITAPDNCPRSVESVAGALLALSRGQNSPLRRVGTGKPARYVPRRVPDTDLDLTTNSSTNCAQDTDRVVLAVRRAAKRRGTSAVTIRDLRHEISTDPELHPRGGRLGKVLDSACRKDLIVGGRRQKLRPSVSRVGRAGQTVYYCLTTELPSAESYVRYTVAELAMARLKLSEGTQVLGLCVIPEVATARAALMLSGVQQLQEAYCELANDDDLDRDRRHSSRDRISELECTAKTLGGWLHFRPILDLQVAEPTALFWIPEEVRNTMACLLPSTERYGNTRKHWLPARIERVPNPLFVRRDSGDRRTSLRWLFDRVDALVFIARGWGGRSFRIHAESAAGELGRLRDASVVRHGLQSGTADGRIVAAACLAFLGDKLSLDTLRDLLTGDPEPGVRESALWAYGFLGGESAVALAAQIASDDPAAYVRAFAADAVVTVQQHPAGWLAV